MVALYEDVEMPLILPAFPDVVVAAVIDVVVVIVAVVFFVGEQDVGSHLNQPTSVVVVVVLSLVIVEMAIREIEVPSLQSRHWQ